MLCYDMIFVLLLTCLFCHADRLHLGATTGAPIDVSWEEKRQATHNTTSHNHRYIVFSLSLYIYIYIYIRSRVIDKQDRLVVLVKHVSGQRGAQI